MRADVSDRCNNRIRAEIARTVACALMRLRTEPGLVEQHVSNTMKRSFRSLTAREALHVAIFIEERNAEIYHRFGEIFAEFRDAASLEIARAFWDMAAEERDHGHLLAKRYRSRYGVRPCHMTDDDVRELIEIPRLNVEILLNTGRISRAPELPQKALEVALEAEHQALIFYEKLAAVTRDTRMRAVYHEFADFEGEHLKWIKKKLRAMRTSARPANLAR